MRPTTDQYFLSMARLAATRATCLRRAVGCIIVNDKNHVLATGYNGVAAGQPHCNSTQEGKHPHACPGSTSESGTNLDACNAIHAEQNALLQCRDVHAIKTIYVTTPPCMTCTKLLLNTSCERIVCLGTYPASGKDLWIKSRRQWDNIATGQST